jgi:hypothetical protein
VSAAAHHRPRDGDAKALLRGACDRRRDQAGRDQQAADRQAAAGLEGSSACYAHRASIPALAVTGAVCTAAVALHR